MIGCVNLEVDTADLTTERHEPIFWLMRDAHTVPRANILAPGTVPLYLLRSADRAAI